MAFKRNAEDFVNEARGENEKKKERKYKMITLYLKDEEKELLKNIATKKRMPLSVYIKDILFNKNKDFLSTIVVEIKLDDAMREKYMYKPKMVSNELYGTTELWSEILILNNAYSVIEFTPRVLKCYDPNRFKSFINEIILLEDVLDD